MHQEINKHFKELSRGLIHDDRYITYSGYSALYRIGLPALPTLEEAILQCDFTDNKFKESSRYVSGLISLIHDIDEIKSKELIEKILSKPCSDHIRKILSSISNYSKSNYNIYKAKDIEILEEKSIKKKCEILPYIENWLGNVPEKDLVGIVRIIICKPENISALGTYMPVLKKISVGWDNNYKASSFMFKMFLFMTESTFYHEIGHHALNHSFGRIPQQEKEAKRYSAEIMNIAHPRIGKIVRALKTIKLLPKCKTSERA